MRLEGKLNVETKNGKKLPTDLDKLKDIFGLHYKYISTPKKDKVETNEVIIIIDEERELKDKDRNTFKAKEKMKKDLKKIKKDISFKEAKITESKANNPEIPQKIKAKS